MNRILFLIIILICTLCSRNSGNAQSMIFSGDSIVVTSCEKYLNALDTIHVYNNTDETFLVRWELIKYSLPHNGGYWLIFEPNQYGPFSTGGYVNIEARDTAWIIFYMYHDTLHSGDSALLQIKVFDPVDSANTSQTLTAIQHCPLQTSNIEPSAETQLHLFPNPMLTDAKILLPKLDQTTSLLLYSITGKLVRQISVAHDEITFSREGLPGGIYYLNLQQKGHLIGRAKVVILE